MVTPDVDVANVGSFASDLSLNLRDSAVLIKSSQSGKVFAINRRSKLGRDESVSISRVSYNTYFNTLFGNFV